MKLDIPKTIRITCAESNIKMSQLAEATRIDKATMSRAWNGNKNCLNIEKIEAIFDYLKLEVRRKP